MPRGGKKHGKLPTKQGLVEASMRNLQKRLKAGETLRAHEMRLLDSYLEGHGPGSLRDPPPPDDPDEPEDVLCSDQKDLAAKAGIHENTVGKWKREGTADPGPRPISLRAYFLLLRRRGKLSQCRPPGAKARDLQRWVFTGGGEPSFNPDDPVHEPPSDWGGERDRQTALKGLVDRQQALVDLETKQRERIPASAVAERMKALADQVRKVLGGFLSIASVVPDLTPEQRIALSEAIQKQITKAQGDLSGPSP